MTSAEPRWHPEAVQDALATRDWYAERSPLAARGFLLAIEEAVDSVTADPHRWPEVGYGCRRYVLPGRYPYSLVYRTAPALEVVAVAHDRREPRFWKER